MNEIIVVFAFCWKDMARLVKNLEWQADLGTRWPSCFLSCDRTVGASDLDTIEQHAKRSYDTVQRIQYGNPSVGDWPPNHAFRETAIAIQKQGKPWLWFEPDMVPLCKDWMGIMQSAYERCRQPFFNPLIPELLHFNGTGVYPADTPQRIPNALTERRTAWDVAMRPEIQHQTADAASVLQHAWMMMDGKLHSSGGGPEPVFRTKADLKNIYPSAVLFHRDKTLSIIERMKEQ